MEKSFSIFENRRKLVEEKLELLLELDRHMYHPDGAPYVLERHEQMQRSIDAAREEIKFLKEEQQRAEAGRCPVCGRSGAGSRSTRRGRGGR